MLVNEVCKKCSLTKKAIEYYEEQGLIAPAVLENGYRNFSEIEVERLSKIAVLRRLGLSVSDIHSVLENSSSSVLYKISERQKLELDDMQARQELVQELAVEQNWDKIRLQLDLLEKKQSILRRLLEKFPGYFGRYASLHFAQFLNEPIETQAQEQAFETIIDFLDNVEITIPEELCPYFEEVTAVFTDKYFQQITSKIASAIHDTEQFISDNKEAIDKYLAYKETEDYKSSPAFKFQETMQSLNKQNGYDRVFLPAMCELSPSYRIYHEQLLRADKELLELYPGRLS